MRPEEFKLAELRAWLDLGTHFLASQVDQLGEDDIGRPSRLSGWTIGHLLTHLARNADALGKAPGDILDVLVDAERLL